MGLVDPPRMSPNESNSRVVRKKTKSLSFLFQLKTFNKQHHAGSGARAQQQAEERVMANIQWHKDNEEDVANWLKDYLEANNIPLN